MQLVALREKGAENIKTPHFSVLFICRLFVKSCIIFFVLHNCVPLCVGLSHKIPIKYIYVHGSNVTKCEKFHRIWKLLQATVSLGNSALLDNIQLIWCLFMNNAATTMFQCGFNTLQYPSLWNESINRTSRHYQLWKAAVSHPPNNLTFFIPS